MKKEKIKIKVEKFFLSRIKFYIKPFDRIHDKQHTASVNEKVSFKKSILETFEDFDEEFYNLLHENE